MMNVSIIAVGKLSEKHWSSAANEYIKRLGAFCKIDIIEIAEARLPKNPSQGEIAKAVESEGKAILAKIPAKAHIISMCIEGKGISSEALAKKIDDTASATSSIAFIIGGSHGIWETIKEKSQLKMSMSAMTFPHQLARVMLLEQVYRAFTINSGLPYHK